MTLEYLIDKYIEKTGYGMDMWSKEENAVMTTVAEIIQESKVNKISSNTLLADSCPTCGVCEHDFISCGTKALCEKEIKSSKETNSHKES